MKQVICLNLLCLVLMTSVAQKPYPPVAAANIMHSMMALRTPPLHIGVTITEGTNFQVPAVYPATAVSAEIYLRKNAAYVRFGEFEQLASDSLALMINDSLQQMFLISSSIADLNQQWYGMLGVGNERMVAVAIDSIYRIEQNPEGYRLLSKADLSGIRTPREVIDLVINERDKQLTRLKITRRSIVLLDSAKAEALKDSGFPADKIIHGRDISYVVKETYMQMDYRYIDTQDGQLPYILSDRIGKDEAGQWKPVSGYVSYQLINQTTL
ncbi:MAG: hypothetical protein ABW007_25530 [Chitinophagaceae bacterium]